MTNCDGLLLEISNMTSKLDDIPRKLRSEQTRLINNSIWVGKASINADKKIEDIISNISNVLSQMSQLKNVISFLKQYEAKLESNKQLKGERAILLSDPLVNAEAIGLLDKQIYAIETDISMLKSVINSHTGN